MKTSHANSGPAGRHYRPELQGLRALAVVAVMLNHATTLPAGGFLGVDVFFVLSGYLITGVLLRSGDKSGTVSFTDFYARRVKRILPLAVVVLATTVLVTQATFNASRAKATLVDAVWATFFGANYRFSAIGTDYFRNQGPTSPLQHFWSLSVEEQFYFVWPVVIAIAFVAFRRASKRHRDRTLWVVMAAMVGLSFATSIAMTSTNSTGAYFSTFARAWELGAGALLALSASALARLPRIVRVVLCWGGLAGIVTSFVLIDDRFAVPGPWAALPVLSCAAVIASGVGGRAPACPPLTNPVSRYFGDISYALYLWHFPVIIIVEVTRPESPWNVCLSLVLAVALAISTHHLIEMPVLGMPWPAHGRDRQRRASAWRRWRRETRPSVKIAAIGSLAFVTAAVGLGAVVSGQTMAPPVALPALTSGAAPPGAPTSTEDGGDTASPGSETVAHDGPEVATLQTEVRSALEAKEWPNLVPTIDAVLDGTREGSSNLACGSSDANGRTQDACSWGPKSATKTMVLVGDSTAMHYLDGLIGVVDHPESTWRLANRAMFACPFLDVSIRTDVAGNTRACSSHNDDTMAYIEKTHPNLVVVTNSYQDFKDDDTGATVTQARWTTGLTAHLDRLEKAGSRVIVLAPPPDDADIESCFTKASVPANCITRTPKLWLTRSAADRATIEKRSGAFIDPRPMMCLDNLCPAFVGTVPVKDDRVHITTAFAKKLSPALGERLGETKLW